MANHRMRSPMAGMDASTPNSTNLHIHGMHVSPQGNSDNIFLQITPGQSQQYDYQIPFDQPSGLYWYHPHFHGFTEPQTGDGMAGALIVQGALDQLPGIVDLRERLLFIQAIQFAGNGQVVPGDQRNQNLEIRTINGQFNPTIRMQPGETQ